MLESTLWISIHALLAEGDVFHGLFAFSHILISIHALLAEGDRSSSCSGVGAS